MKLFKRAAQNALRQEAGTDAGRNGPPASIQAVTEEIASVSFNVRGEPIVCTPKDAFSCFGGTEIEVAVENCLLHKGRQN